VVVTLATGADYVFRAIRLRRVVPGPLAGAGDASRAGGTLDGPHEAASPSGDAGTGK
jgi:hypothetical protein